LWSVLARGLDGYSWQSSINTSVGRYDEAVQREAKPIIWAWGIMPEMALSGQKGTCRP